MVDSTSTGTDYDPFDPAALRVHQDFATLAGVSPILAGVPVRKPHRQDFIRVHPSPEYQVVARVLEMSRERETYWIDPVLQDHLVDETREMVIYTTQNTFGTTFLWPVKTLADRDNPWLESAHYAAHQAKEKWIRVQSDQTLGHYRVAYPHGNLGDPEWPKEKMRDLLELAFKNRFIKEFDHPVLKRLRGDI